MVRVTFIHAHNMSKGTPGSSLNEVAAKWHGKPIQIAQPVPPANWHHCAADLVWRIAEPEMLKDIIAAGGSPLSCICRHMFEGAD